VDVQELKEEIPRLGHTVRNIINARHRVTKDPLNLFFVDLEPSGNNKDIYKISRLQNSVIQIEPPRQGKHIVQCTRCQLYGHTKSYCNRPYVCVKCSGQHSTASCKKNNTTPATCALCGGDHPANYKGCDFYQKQYHAKYSTQRPYTTHSPSTDRPPQPQAIPRSQHKNCAQALRGTESTLASPNVDEPMSLPTFLREFNPLKPELNPICYLLALLGAHHFLHVSRIRVKLLTFRLLMSYVYRAPILDVSRSHTTTQHRR